MSSAAAQARQKRAETRGDAWCTRPAALASNAHLPRYGWLVQHALYMSAAIVLKAMFSLKPQELKDKQGRPRGWVLNDASITRIAKATARFTNPLSDAPGEPMARRTVAHCLQALARKGFIERFDINTAKTNPAGTSWFIRRYDDILQAWADSPDIGTVGKRAFYVIGKGRRHMTPAEMVTWDIRPDIARLNPRAYAPDIGAVSPAAALEPEPAAAPDFEPLIEALIAASGRGTAADAAWLWKEVERGAGSRAIPPVDIVARGVRQMAADRRGRGQLDHGLIAKKIAGYLEPWHRNGGRDRLEAERAARIERAARVETLAEFLRDMERGDLPPPDRALLAEAIAAASPDDIDAAREVLARSV